MDLCTYIKTIYMHCYKKKQDTWLNTVMFVLPCFSTQKEVYRYLSGSFVLQLFPLMIECGKLPTFPFNVHNIAELLSRAIGDSAAYMKYIQREEKYSNFQANSNAVWCC